MTTPPAQRLSLEDADDYRALMLEAYAHPDAFTSTVEERAALPIDWWRSRIAAADAADAAFGVRRADRLVGVGALTFETRERTRHKATLVGMYVQPVARGAGVADAIVAALLDHARSRPDARVVVLTLTDGNDRARRLYERHGFAAFGLEPLAIRVGGAYRSKLHMACDLRAVVAPSATARSA